jgi:hypothetical protein
MRKSLKVGLSIAVAACFVSGIAFFFAMRSLNVPVRMAQSPQKAQEFTNVLLLQHIDGPIAQYAIGNYLVVVSFKKFDEEVRAKEGQVCTNVNSMSRSKPLREPCFQDGQPEKWRETVSSTGVVTGLEKECDNFCFLFFRDALNSGSVMITDMRTNELVPQIKWISRESSGAYSYDSWNGVRFPDGTEEFMHHYFVIS